MAILNGCGYGDIEDCDGCKLMKEHGIHFEAVRKNLFLMRGSMAALKDKDGYMQGMIRSMEAALDGYWEELRDTVGDACTS